MKILALTLCAVSLYAADTASEVFDRQLKNTEGEFVPLVEAMPADKFDFAPTQGEFKGVRTFAAQAKHVAAVLDLISAAMLGEKAPNGENGPDKAVTKEQIVQYVKDSFAHAHKAMASLTNANLMTEIQDPFNSKVKKARVAVANEVFWHTFDHYGQMVEYLRMNGMVPPASR